MRVSLRLLLYFFAALRLRVHCIRDSLTIDSDVGLPRQASAAAKSAASSSTLTSSGSRAPWSAKLLQAGAATSAPVASPASSDGASALAANMPARSELTAPISAAGAGSPASSSSTVTSSHGSRPARCRAFEQAGAEVAKRQRSRPDSRGAGSSLRQHSTALSAVLVRVGGHIMR